MGSQASDWDTVAAVASSQVRGQSMIAQRVGSFALVVTVAIVLGLMAVQPPFLRRPATEDEVSRGYSVGAYKMSWSKLGVWTLVIFIGLFVLLWSSESRK